MKRPRVRTGIHDVPHVLGTKTIRIWYDLIIKSMNISSGVCGVVFMGTSGTRTGTNGYGQARAGTIVLRIVRLYYGWCNCTTDSRIVLRMK